MKTNTIEIPFKLPTLNEYINAERSNKFKAASLKRSEQFNIFWEIKEYLELNPNSLYDISMKIETKDNRKDHDNLMFSLKFILDALVKYKYLSGDGRKNIRHIKSEIYTTGRDFYTVEFIEVL